MFTMVIGGRAYALDPETTSLVSKPKVEIPHSHQQTDTTVYIGETDCKQLLKTDSKIKVTYPTTINTLIDSKHFDGIVTFKVPRNSTARIDCSKDPAFCTAIEKKYITQKSTDITIEREFDELTGITTEQQCEKQNIEFFVRAQLRQKTSDETFSLSDIRLVIDTEGPTAPTLNGASATQSTLVLEFTSSNDQDIEGFAAVISTEPLTQGTLPNKTNAQVILFGNKESIKSNIPVVLDPKKTYHVGVSARDETGNVGPVSNVKTVQPVETIDFWNAYKGAGGSEEGGCATVPLSSPLSLLFVWLMASGYRKRRRWSSRR